MNTNTVQLVESFGSKLDQYIGVIAEKAGVATDYFWPIFVRQQLIEGYSMLILLFAILLITILMFRMGFKNIDSKKDNCKCGIGFGIAAVFSFILLVTVPANGVMSVEKVLNPEYFAVKSITEMVK